MSEYIHTKEFLLDFANGESQAFKALHGAYFPKLTAVAHKIVRNYCEAEDIAIEALSRLMIAHSKYVYGSFTLDRLNNHLYLSVRNRCLNYLTSFRRTTRANDKEVEQTLNGAYVESVEESMIYGEVIAHLSKALEGLPQERRMALELVYYEDKKVKDAAVQMDVSLSTFKNIRQRAFKDISQKVPGREIISSLLVFLTWFS